MKILTPIVLILAGIGAIGWSYAGGLVTLAGEVERAARAGDSRSVVVLVMELILSGEIPQLTAFLYIGVLLIAVGVVTLIVREKRDDR